MAPEVGNARGRYTTKADVYSFAIVMWEIWAKRLPFEECQARRDYHRGWWESRRRKTHTESNGSCGC
jgi:hypothetical protein